MIGTIHGAPTAMAVERMTRATSIRVAMVDTTRHERASSSLAMRPATTGMSAELSAPAATSWKTRSGIRNAAK